MRRIIILSLYYIVVIYSGGCSRSSLDTEYITGKVTLDSEPVAEARVIFAPPDGGVPAYGVTNAKGIYEVTAVQGGGKDKGTVVGRYLVGVSKLQSTMVSENPIRYETKHLLPLVYSDPEQSQFEVNVVKGKNEFNFDLKSNPDTEFKAKRRSPTQRGSGR